jgi:hypothetical protein
MKKVYANGDSDGEVDDIKMRKYDASSIQSLLNTAPYSGMMKLLCSIGVDVLHRRPPVPKP